MAIDSELIAYLVLIDQLDGFDPQPDHVLRKVLISDQYKDFMAGWMGVEIASFYLSYDSEAREFLHEALKDKDRVPDMPMFYVHETSDPNEARHQAQRITNQAVIDERRLKQRSFLPVGEKPLTAELCARRLQKAIRQSDSPHYILIPFGEIVSYCFLYHVINNIASSNEGQSPDWSSIGNTAWNTICAQYSKSRRHTEAETVEDILNNVKAWYKLSAKIFDERKKLNGTVHSAIYILPAELSALLEGANNEPPSKSATLSVFLARWAAFICGNINTDERNEKLTDQFWNCTIVNPEIEQFLGSRSLYVTVVHSQVSKEPSGIPALNREVYAICTLFTSSRLEQGNNQSYLDNILRRLAQTQLAQFEYEELERHYEKLSGTLNLLNSIANPSHDWQRLTEEAITLCGTLASAKVVFLAWPDIGVCTKVFDKNHDGFQWYHYLSKTNQLAKNTARLIRRSENVQLTLEQRTEAKEAKDEYILRITSEVPLQQCTKCDTLEFTFGSGDRGLLIVWFENLSLGDSVSKELKRALLALTIGLEMPYRSAIGRGALSLLLNFIVDRKTTKNELISRIQGCQQEIRSEHRSPIHSLLTWLVATIAEISQLGYVVIAFVFLASVYIILLRTVVEAIFGTGGETKSSIVSTLNTVEHTVMAFSICLASTGVIFLLKPDMAANLPSWMRSFGKLGTLEKTLVRLAAMVLTIDVLAATLELRMDLKTNKGVNFWETAGPALFYVILYLVVLTGLAFLSRYLLKEESDPDADAADDKEKREDN